MRKHWLAAGAAAGIALAPLHAQAYEIVGKRLEIYGKANVSLEYQDSGTGRSVSGTRGRTTSGGEIGVSSNSSRLGFKGTIPLGTGVPLSALYQFEQEINVDRGGGDTFATRNSFFGLGTEIGDLLLGFHDSAFKVIGEDFTIWGDTVADRRTILGASPFNGSRMDVRLKNMVMYRFKSEQVLLIAQYSTDQQTQNFHDPDLNNNGSFSAGGEYKFGIFTVGAGFERDRKDLAFGATGRHTWGARAGAAIDLKPVKLSFIYEHIDPRDGVAVVAGRPTSAMGTLGRDAFGGSVLYNVTPQLAFGAQVLHATKVRGTSGTAATNYSLGTWYDLTDWASVYLIGSMTVNQRNARYAVGDGGHGDRISTDFGRDPRVVSAGFVFKF